MKCTDQTACLLQDMDRQREMFRLLPPGEIVPRIVSKVPIFLNALVDYLDIQGSLLPKTLKLGREEEELECENMSKIMGLRGRVMKNLKAKKNYAVYVVFMSHWLRGGKLKNWKMDFLSTLESFRYEQWTRRFISSYQALPRKLLDTLVAQTAAGDSDGSNSNLSFYLNKKTNMYNV